MSRHILVTRPAGQAADLSEALRAHGLVPVEVPTVAVESDGAAAALDAMLDRLGDAEWLVLTSRNGASALATRLAATERRLPGDLRVAAVGPATAGTLREAGIGVDHVPEEYLTVAIANGLGDVRGRRVVLARADQATPDLRDALVARGAVVEEVVAYRTVEGPASSRDAFQVALHHGLEGVAFTSGSTVRGLMRLASPIDRGRVRTVPAFCIGPVTARMARQQGFDVAAVADPHTAAGLAEAVAHHFQREDA